jgi:hypothetical protein
MKIKLWAVNHKGREFILESEEHDVCGRIIRGMYPNVSGLGR